MTLSYKTIIKHFGISVSLILILCAVLSVGVSRAQEKEPGLHVRILLYSGVKDPEYTINTDEVLGKLKNMLNQAKVNKTFAETTVIPSRLGYKGILASNPGNIPELPTTFAVYKGNIEIKDKERKFLIDKDSVIENFLLEQAIKKKIIDDRTMKLIKHSKK